MSKLNPGDRVKINFNKLQSHIKNRPFFKEQSNKNRLFVIDKIYRHYYKDSIYFSWEIAQEMQTMFLYEDELIKVEYDSNLICKKSK